MRFAHRRMLSHIAQLLAPGYSTCKRCNQPWKFVEPHSVPHADDGGLFALCEECWMETTPAERLPFYEELWNEWTDPPNHDGLARIRKEIIGDPVCVPPDVAAALSEVAGLAYRHVFTTAAHDEHGASCYDCNRPYGHEHGFPDLIIPYRVWKEITPTKDDGGLLCPSCICKRLHDAGRSCEGAFMSGPISSVSRDTMDTMRRVENIELAIEGRDNRWAAVRELVAVETAPILATRETDTIRSQIECPHCRVTTYADTWQGTTCPNCGLRAWSAPPAPA